MTVPPRTAGRTRRDGRRTPRRAVPGPITALTAVLAAALAATAPFAPAATARTAQVSAAPALTDARISAAPAKLVCTAATEPGRPVTFTPAVGLLPAPVETKGTLRLSSCTSPDGSQSRLKSGRLAMKGSGRASCTGVSGLRSQGTITWYDSRGRAAGTSKIRSGSRELSGTNPADALLVGKVVSGPMKGRRVAGSATPTTDLTSCTVSGVSAVEGSGRLTVS
ncbi:hypothetical protein HS048_25840 [Planomonospora sp. ID91781]|uniref:hypothetical protein n=1 Tax=Planomonospora sp. ID91781 TaxID=2738135 RepID=UPI0018C3C5ED|nr:hypothetical protein [Planomonospora sp. ID91781]MBG0824134.1 hypothetical protein [Planomonospora sp. ID91781]